MVSQRMRDMERHFTVLAGAEDFAGSALAEVLFGYFEAVGCGAHGLEAFAGGAGNHLWCDENASGCLFAAANTAAQLMKLGEAEAIGMLDDHGRGVWNVDTDFDYCGGH